MIVDASKIEELTECHPFWQVPYQLVELDEFELRENNTLTVKEEEELLNITSQTVQDIIDDICLRDDLGLGVSKLYTKLMAIYTLIDYLNIYKSELAYCPNDDETYDEFLLRKREEFKIDCIQKQFICEYELNSLFEQVYNAMGIPRLGTQGGGIGQMTINNNSCNIFTVYKTK